MKVPILSFALPENTVLKVPEVFGIPTKFLQTGVSWAWNFGYWSARQFTLVLMHMIIVVAVPIVPVAIALFSQTERAQSTSADPDSELSVNDLLHQPWSLQSKYTSLLLQNEVILGIAAFWLVCIRTLQTLLTSPPAIVTHNSCWAGSSWWSIISPRAISHSKRF